MHIISNCFECDDLSHIVVIFFDNSKGIVRENYSLFRLVGNHIESLFSLIYYCTIINVYIYMFVSISPIFARLFCLFFFISSSSNHLKSVIYLFYEKCFYIFMFLLVEE